jgi:hypothetical protein
MLRRASAGAAGLALLAVALAGAALVTFAIGLIVPADPFGNDGDPCCLIPDTLGEVYTGAAWAAGVAAATVRAVLGRPDAAGDARWRYPALDVLFDHGRVAGTRFRGADELD